ncbi:MAG: DUF2334 domain-containing protein [Kiritimatiellae bacterium]|nr:DUF2334 domain-containing protein [Kiritimatiellia bacterium]
MGRQPGRHVLLAVLACTGVLGWARSSPASESDDILYKPVVIYHDAAQSDNAKFYVNMLRNLLGHFRASVRFSDVSAYSEGDLADFETAFYIGSYFDNPLPADFLGDVSSFTNTFVWMHYNIWQLLWSTNATAHTGIGRYDWVTNLYDKVTYKGEDLFKHEDSVLVCVDTNDYGTIRASAASWTNEAVTAVPYAIEGSNFWYIADNPFAYVLPGDRALVLADLLHEILGASAAGLSHRALVRIEDLDPGQVVMDDVCTKAAALAALGVPASFGVIPRYMDPEQLYIEMSPPDVRMSEDPDFLARLREVKRTGATLLAHGYTHQHGNQLSGDGYEFWDDDIYAPGPNLPLPYDGWDWAAGRVADSAREFLEAALPVAIWETPHYTASLVDRHVFADRYRVHFEGISVYDVFTGGATRAELEALSTNHVSGVDQVMPYPVRRSVYGTTVLPENLGYLAAGHWDSAGLEMVVSNKMLYARRLKVVRDAVACFYYHPFLDLADLTNLVEQMQGEGYTFVSPETLYREDPLPCYPESGVTNTGTYRGYDAVTAAIDGDLVLGGAGVSNVLEIVNAGVLSNRQAFIGLNDTAAENRATVSGAGSLWTGDDTFTVGGAGCANSLLLTNGGWLLAAETLVGRAATAHENSVLVTGPGTLWSNHYGVTVGAAGVSNRVTLAAGAQAESLSCEVGTGSGATANALTVTGAGSTWSNRAHLVLGGAGSCNTFTVADGGRVEAGYAFVGLEAGATGNTVRVTGAGSCWSNAGNLVVGVEGSGNLFTIETGTVVSVGSLVVGQETNAVDNAVVLDGGALSATNAVIVGGGLLELAAGTMTTPHLLIGAGGTVNVAPEFDLSGVDQLTVNGGHLSVARPLAVGPPALNLLGGSLAADGLLIGASGTVTIAGDFDLSGAGSITNEGWVQLDADAGLALDLVLAGNGVLAGTGGALTLEGDLLNSSSNAANNMLGLSIAFTTGTTHTLSTGSLDLTNTLAGFCANQALGRLEARGTVDVANVVYAWSLAGDGQLDLGEGDRFYYVEALDWTGQVQLSGDAVFQQVYVLLNAVGRNTDGDIQLDWAAGPGLHFELDWTDELTGTWAHAASITAASNSVQWIDNGETNRPAPDQSSHRFYQLDAWP